MFESDFQYQISFPGLFFFFFPSFFTLQFGESEASKEANDVKCHSPQLGQQKEKIKLKTYLV